MREAAGSASDQAKIDHLVFESFERGLLKLGIDRDGASVARWLGTQGEWVAQLVERATGTRVRVQIDTSQAEPRAAAGVDPADVEAARGLPAVRQAMELFDAVVTQVQAEVQADDPTAGGDSAGSSQDV